MYKKTIFWFRNDLRLNDNIGLWYALKNSDSVLCVFVMDKNHTENIGFNNKKQEFTLNAAKQLKILLKLNGSDLIFLHDYPEEAVVNLSKKHSIEAVFCNEGYTPSMRQSENNVKEKLAKFNINFHSYKDSVIFAKNEILSTKGEPYQSFSSYSNNWHKKISPEQYQFFDTSELLSNLSKFKQSEIIYPIELKITSGNDFVKRLGASQDHALKMLEIFIKNKVSSYHLNKNYPSKAGVSYLSVHLSHGIISIRQLLSVAMKYGDINSDAKDGCNTWINQICWRDFFSQQIYHYPKIIYEPYNSMFNNFQWNSDLSLFQKWCEGKTGYPIVDAAMRQLKQTGYMHNRLRMITSSFLTKHLLIDYRLGEKYFEETLLDFEPASNNAGWQWASSTGCDAQPFYKILNPVIQSEKFDSDAQFIKRFLPELRLVDSDYLHDIYRYRKEILNFGIRLGFDYPEPIVDNNAARERAIRLFDEHSKMLK